MENSIDEILDKLVYNSDYADVPVVKQALYTRLLEVIGADEEEPSRMYENREHYRNLLRAAQRQALAELFNVGGDDA